MLVRYFAAAAASAGVAEEHVHREQPITRAQLHAELVARHPDPPAHERPLESVLPQCSWLVDGSVLRDPDRMIAPTATVDVLPPFAGG